MKGDLLLKRYALLCLMLMLAACGGGAQAPTPPLASFAKSVSSFDQAVMHPYHDTIYAMMMDHVDDNFIGVFSPPFSGYPPPVTIGYWSGRGDDIAGPVLDAQGNVYTIIHQDLGVFAPPSAPMKSQVLANLPYTSHTPALALSPTGNLFVANYDSNIVYEYARPYNGVPVARIQNLVSQPYWLGFDGNANLFVANNGSHALIKYAAPSYTGSPTSITTIPLPAWAPLAVDAVGDVFIADSAGNRVEEYVRPYGAHPKIITAGISGPKGLTLDGRNNLFVVNAQNLSGPFPWTQTVIKFASPYTSPPSVPVELIYHPTQCCDSGSWMQGPIVIHATF